MSLETIATLFASHVVIMGIGITIGTMVVKNGLFEKVWVSIRNRNWKKNDPRQHCPHVRVERRDDGCRIVVDDFHLDDGHFRGAMECNRCGKRMESRDHPGWLSRDLPLWQDRPDKAEKQVAKAEKIARRNRGWTYRAD